MKWQHLIDKLEGGYADKTIAGYRGDFADFAAWARRKRLAALPAAAVTLARYVDDIGESLKPSSVRRKLAAIRKVHRLAGFENVAAAEEVVLALRRVRRSKPGRPEQALPGCATAYSCWSGSKRYAGAPNSWRCGCRTSPATPMARCRFWSGAQRTIRTALAGRRICHRRPAPFSRNGSGRPNSISVRSCGRYTKIASGGARSILPLLGVF